MRLPSPALNGKKSPDEVIFARTELQEKSAPGRPPRRIDKFNVRHVGSDHLLNRRKSAVGLVRSDCRSSMPPDVRSGRSRLVHVHPSTVSWSNPPRGVQLTSAACVAADCERQTCRVQTFPVWFLLLWAFPHALAGGEGSRIFRTPLFSLRMGYRIGRLELHAAQWPARFDDFFLPPLSRAYNRVPLRAHVFARIAQHLRFLLSLTEEPWRSLGMVLPAPRQSSIWVA
jgi:hypothetical protein